MQEVWKWTIGSFLLRLIVILITTTLEESSNLVGSLKYTDIDYYVFHDAAEYITLSRSPYERLGYRYPPLLALLVTSNIYIHRLSGKFIFAAFDSLITYVTYEFLNEFEEKNNTTKSRETAKRWATIWTFNVVSINICTRGSADSITNFFVIVLIHVLVNLNDIMFSGAILGFLVYWRIYPVIYITTIVAFLFSAESDMLSRLRNILCFGVTATISCAFFVCLSLMLYGSNYLDLAVFYHFTRNDFKHNFSIYFYPSYLYLSGESSCQENVCLADVNQSVYVTIAGYLLMNCSLVPQLVVNLLFSWLLYRRKLSISSTMLLQTIAFVAYNKVITAQYFTWFICLLPAALGTLPADHFSMLPAHRILISSAIWSMSVIFWLYEAYLLEFAGVNTFQLIWIATLVFHAANTLCISELLDILRLP